MERQSPLEGMVWGGPGWGVGLLTQECGHTWQDSGTCRQHFSDADVHPVLLHKHLC